MVKTWQTVTGTPSWLAGRILDLDDVPVVEQVEDVEEEVDLGRASAEVGISRICVR